MLFQAIKNGFSAEKTNTGKSPTQAGSGDLWATVARDLSDLDDQRMRARAAAEGATSFDAVSSVVTTAWLRSRRNAERT